MRFRSGCAAVLVLVVAGLSTAADSADARRVCLSCKVKIGPIVKRVPQTCRVRTFTATVRSGAFSRRLVVRLDGRILARGDLRSYSFRVDCSRLRPGEHRIAASVRLGATNGKLVRVVTFRVLPPRQSSRSPR